MTALIAVDIGGTHARFAFAEVAEGRVVSLGKATKLHTADYPDLPSAWRAFGAAAGRVLPRAAAIAIAGPVGGEIIRFTNNPWTIRPADLGALLEVDTVRLVNDFEAVGHAVAQADDAHFRHLCGPETALPPTGTISIVGPGTGLGVGQVWRSADSYHVQATEGGHIGFAPTDMFEDGLLAWLRGQHGRVSAERAVSGPGLIEIYEILAETENQTVQRLDDKSLWTLALSGESALASAALDRFCRMLGSVAGDIALAQGGSAMVIAGGLGLRIGDRLIDSGFAERFIAKGRFETYMAGLPVKLITHPEPGLFGAAAAFARLN